MTQMQTCPYAGFCGGCSLIGQEYAAQLAQKQKRMEKLFPGVSIEPVIGMNYPYRYRHKVQAAFGRDRDGRIICGTYEEGSHRIVPIDDCLIQNKKANEILRFIRESLPGFHIEPFDEDRGTGHLRHVLVRISESTGRAMVVLVASSSVLPSRRRLAEALMQKFPYVETVVQSVNSRHTSMVLGDREKEIVLAGPGYLTDRILGCSFRISPTSFCQVNPLQMKKLYRRAMEYAFDRNNPEKNAVKGSPTDPARPIRILDAYCGTGTIGLIAADTLRKAGCTAQVTGVERNPAAVSDAKKNAAAGKFQNVTFICRDAGEYMKFLSASGRRPDVLFLDPPRAGSSKAFLQAVLTLAPDRIVYISCEPDTLARDVKILGAGGYTVNRLCPVDMFPQTEKIECAVLLSRAKAK